MTFFPVSSALVESLIKTSGRAYSQPQGARWGPWETWSTCSQHCSRGFRTRKRSCSTPEGRTNPAACAGSPVEYQDCNIHPCSGTSKVLAVGAAVAEHYVTVTVCLQWMEAGPAGLPGPSARPAVEAGTTSGHGRAAARPLRMEATSVSGCTQKRPYVTHTHVKVS